VAFHRLKRSTLRKGASATNLALREKSRDMWGWNWLENLVQDIRYGLRMLARRPGLAAVVILTLGLGIGANTATFSVVDAVLLRPLTYKNPDRLVVIWEAEIGHAGPSKVFDSYRDSEEWQRSVRSFEKLEALTWAHAGQIRH